MEIVRVEGTHDDWERFVYDAPCGTIFSSRKFLSYHPRSRFDRLDLAVMDGKDLVCVIAGGADRDSTGARWFRSPVGGSFGGFVVRDDRDLREIADVVDAVTGEIRTAGFVGAEVVLPPDCYCPCADRGLAFALGRAGYRVVCRDATAVVDLDGVDREDLDPVVQRNLRKAEREGLYVRATTDLGGFYRVLESNLAEKGAEPTHSLKELEGLFSLLPDRFVLLEATAGDRPVGGCLLMLCNSRVGLAFYICDDRDHRHLRVSEAAIFAAMSLLKRTGYRYLDLGTISKGDQVNWGLARFKAKFRAMTQVREHFAIRFEETH
jgi:hypothetical protein